MQVITASRRLEDARAGDNCEGKGVADADVAGFYDGIRRRHGVKCTSCFELVDASRVDWRAQAKDKKKAKAKAPAKAVKAAPKKKK